MTELHERVTQGLSNAMGMPVRIASIRPLGGGACQDNFVLDVDLGSGTERVVLRSDALSSLPGSLDRRREFAVVNAATTASVRTPRARALTKGLVRDDAWAYLLDWSDGDAVGRKIVRDPSLADARKGLAADLARELAKIHAVTDEGELTNVLGEKPVDPVAVRLADFRVRIDALKTKRLAFEWIYAWLCEHAPRTETSVLVHGDFRTGNFLVAPSGLKAILDWEFSRWGSPYEDMAWISLRDWRFSVLHRPIGGFAARREFYEAYEAASGTPVDLARVHYFEVLGNLLWAIGSVAQAERAIYGGEESVEYLAIGRRVSEMEWEALRLIERGTIQC